MKIRVAKIESNRRMDGEYLVQRKGWFFWYDMYYNSKEKSLREEQAILGDAITKRAVFDDFHEAHRLAQRYKSKLKETEKILETWVV